MTFPRGGRTRQSEERDAFPHILSASRAALVSRSGAKLTLEDYVSAPLAQKAVNHAVAMMASAAVGTNGGGTSSRADLEVRSRFARHCRAPRIDSVCVARGQLAKARLNDPGINMIVALQVRLRMICVYSIARAGGLIEFGTQERFADAMVLWGNDRMLGLGGALPLARPKSMPRSPHLISRCGARCVVRVNRIVPSVATLSLVRGGAPAPRPLHEWQHRRRSAHPARQ